MSNINLERSGKITHLRVHSTLEQEEKVVKRALLDGRHSANVKQEIVAKVLDLNQSSISRMENPEDDLHLSAAQLSLLHLDPFTAPVADEVMMAMGARFNLADAQTDGDFLDEFFELTSVDGKLSEIIKGGVQAHEHNKIMKLASHLQDIASRLILEVEKARDQKH